MNNNDIDPSNYPPDGVISYTGGQPLIQFQIGARNSALVGRSVRFNGKIKFTEADGTLIGANEVLIPNLGVYSIFDQLTISSATGGNDIESILSYNRYLASAYKSTLGLQKQANGQLIENIGPTCVFMPNNILNADDAGAANELCFSLELPCGLFSSGDVPLSQDTTGGLIITLNLTPDANLFYGLTTDGKTAANGCKYSLSDVHLTFQDRELSSQEMSMKSMMYNSISTHYRTISSSHSSINLNLGASRVLSVFMNFIPQENINSYDHNTLDTPIITDANGDADLVSRVQFLKGGRLIPFQFNIESHNGDNHQLSTQIARYFKECFTNNILTSSEAYRSQVNTPNNTNLTPVDSEFNYGIGVNLDSISNLGFNYSTDEFGILLDKKSANPKDHTAFIFVKSVNMINFNGNGSITIDN
jgi:hypothetical protein